jgi:hypothetical protein
VVKEIDNPCVAFGIESLKQHFENCPCVVSYPVVHVDPADKNIASIGKNLELEIFGRVR